MMAPKSSSSDCPPRYSTARNRSRVTYGPKVAETASLLGLELMPWQRHVADIALEVDSSTGQLAYREVVLTVPRQSGKTTLQLAVMVHRALGFGGPQNIVYTAQDRNHALLKWADEHVPALQRSQLNRLFTVRRQRGAEAVMWANGSRHSITAPSETAGHSQTLDCAMVDEGWARTDDRLEQGLSPTMITRPQPQLWVVSTAGTASSTWLRSKVDAGRAAPQGRRTAYFEWSADPLADPADPETWRSCMPALGHTIAEDTIQAEYDRLDRDAFIRSYLNVWADEAPRLEWLVISEAEWQACLDPRSQPVGRVALALDITPDRQWASIAAAGRRADGLLHVELVEHRAGTAWVVERLTALIEKWSPYCLVIDAGSAAGALIPELEAAGVRITRPAVREVAGASAALFDETRPETLGVRHLGQVPLTRAVAGAAQRPLADAWTWNRRGSTVVISPLVACSLASWGLVAHSRPLQLFVTTG
jgi:phage terminase large subunit-like protein